MGVDEQVLGVNEQELYFLILQYLAQSPCQEAFHRLEAECADKKLLPTRTDVFGEFLNVVFPIDARHRQVACTIHLLLPPVMLTAHYLHDAGCDRF